MTGGDKTCFSSSGLCSWLRLRSLLILSLCDMLARFELKDQEVEAVRVKLPSSLLLVIEEGDMGVCVLERSLQLASLSNRPMFPFECSKASRDVQSLRVTSSTSLRRSVTASLPATSALKDGFFRRCIARSNLTSTVLLSLAACKTSMASAWTEASSRASSASSSLLRSVRMLFASGL